jgi:hypothetical protein
MTLTAALRGALLLLATPLLGQTIAPVSLTRVVSGTPVSKMISIGKVKGELLTWQVKDPFSPYSGTTLVWLEVPASAVRLSVDGDSTFENIAKSGLNKDASVIAIVSGGSWSGAYDRPWKDRKPDGYVVSNGVKKGEFKPFNSGGIAVICSDDVRIMPIANFPKTPDPRCNNMSELSALQSNVVLVRGGKPETLGSDSPSNRISLCTGRDRIVVAGAFNSTGHSLTLRQFADFIAAAAQQRKIADFNAMNLAGDCAAQLFIPQLNVRFGCGGANYSVNKIVMRQAK